MKYLAIVSALLASQAMGAMAVSCPSSYSLRVLNSTVLATLNIPTLYFPYRESLFPQRTCPPTTVCCNLNGSGPGSGTGLLSLIASVTSTTGICATSCDCVPGSTPA
ncbi:hypothetical protein BD779DRAFT_1477568 [Infundibulicybe gibba]|nr:hypothetical protein BD779DRAFT_1477568 [Infundibulicybe gibba]